PRASPAFPTRRSSDLAFVYAGLVGVGLRHTETAGATPARAGALIGAFAFAVWSLNILFMVGAGWQLAHAYTASDTGLTGTHAVRSEEHTSELLSRFDL